jgi:hypothetical protein
MHCKKISLRYYIKYYLSYIYFIKILNTAIASFNLTRYDIAQCFAMSSYDRYMVITAAIAHNAQQQNSILFDIIYYFVQN